ncbi:MAG: hypothetical protein ACKVS6_09290 [Planctomycetota bacterium]
MQRRPAFDTILVKPGSSGLGPRRTALMATFHFIDNARERPERYSMTPAAAIVIAALLIVGAAGAIVLTAPAGLGAVGFVMLTIALPMTLPFAAPYVSRESGPNRIVKIAAAIALAVFGSGIFILGVAPMLKLGALSASLAVLLAGAARVLPASFAAAVPVAGAVWIAVTSAAPFALVDPDSSLEIQQFAASLFQYSPIAAACGAVPLDILRNDFLYRTSAFGSSIPVGYPSWWLHAIAALAAGILMILIAARLQKPARDRMHN